MLLTRPHRKDFGLLEGTAFQFANMSEANSYVGTVGTWVAGIIVLFTQSFLAYMAYRKGWSPLIPDPNANNDQLLNELLVEVWLLRHAAEANRDTLRSIERIAVEVQNDAGGMLAIQRLPHSSGQNQDTAHSQQV